MMDPLTRARLLQTIQFPQMTANESQIVHAWLAKHIDEWDSIDFNVRVGTSLDLGPTFSDAIRGQAAILSQKRADIVAQRPDAAAIIEVKIRVNLGALGQLLGYSVLWRAEYPDTTNLQLIAIGHDALLDVVEVLQAHGVHVELFPNAALATLPNS
jgi:hypothetical protein